MSHAEIGQALGISRTTAYRILRDAKAHVEQALAEDQSGDEPDI